MKVDVKWRRPWHLLFNSLATALMGRLIASGPVVGDEG